MITLYAHGTPNPHKVAIALEELQLPYRSVVVDIHQGEQFQPEFLRVNPNAKVPVIHDDETDITVYESNAILLYLAEKAGRYMPTGGAERWEAIQLLFLQAACVGPMWGQRAHFSLFAPEKLSYAIGRYEKESQRLNQVLEALLKDREYFLASGYSIVDMAIFGWAWCAVHQGFALDAFPKLHDWYERVAERPAVRKGVTVPVPLPDFSPYRGVKTP